MSPCRFLVLSAPILIATCRFLVFVPVLFAVFRFLVHSAPITLHNVSLPVCCPACRFLMLSARFLFAAGRFSVHSAPFLFAGCRFLVLSVRIPFAACRFRCIVFATCRFVVLSAPILFAAGRFLVLLAAILFAACRFLAFRNCQHDHRHSTVITASDITTQSLAASAVSWHSSGCTAAKSSAFVVFCLRTGRHIPLLSTQS